MELRLLDNWAFTLPFHYFIIYDQLYCAFTLSFTCLIFFFFHAVLRKIFSAQEGYVIWRSQAESLAMEESHWGTSKPVNLLDIFCLRLFFLFEYNVMHRNMEIFMRDFSLIEKILNYKNWPRGVTPAHDFCFNIAPYLPFWDCSSIMLEPFSALLLLAPSSQTYIRSSLKLCSLTLLEVIE